LRAHVKTTDARETAALVPSSDADLLLQCPQFNKAEGGHIANACSRLATNSYDGCPLPFDGRPGETSRIPGDKLVNMSEVTRVLSAIEQGDPSAAKQLLPLVYEELRKLAATRLAQEKPGQTPGHSPGPRSLRPVGG